MGWIPDGQATGSWKPVPATVDQSGLKYTPFPCMKYNALRPLLLAMVLGALIPSRLKADDAVSIALGRALDITGLEWTAVGRWGPSETTLAHDHVDAAMGGGGRLQTSIEGPGTLTFWWSLPGLNPDTRGAQFMSFSIDGLVQPGSIDGGVPWQKKTFVLTSGAHVLEWSHWITDTDLRLFALLDQVSYRPLIRITGPADQAASTGSAATFNVVGVSGNPPLTYQWQLDGTNLPGETADTLTLTDVQLAQVGFYRVIVMDSTGAASATTSAKASLALLDSPPVAVTGSASQMRGS